jgi:long-chain acyl-CoA synthetase
LNQEQPWFTGWPAGIPKSLEYPEVPLYSILSEVARKYPKLTAISYFDKQLNYFDLEQFSNKFAAGLSALGVKKGDRVALFLPNIPQFVISYYGILKAGAVLTAISPLHRKREVEYQLKDSDTGVIILLDSLYPVVETVLPWAHLKAAILTNLDDFSPIMPRRKSGKDQPEIFSFEDVLKTGTEFQKVSVNPIEDLAALQYTGGTTGVAKGAMLTHANLVSNTIAFATWIRRKMAKETFLGALPLFHIYGMTTSMNVPISLAAKTVLLPRFEPAQALETIRKHQVTVFCGVPTMYALLLADSELGKFDLTSIRVCVSGASPLPPQVQKKFMQFTGGSLVEGYGLTEASPVTHCNPVGNSSMDVHVGSIGLPLPGTEAKIVDMETGKSLGIGDTGELAVKGPQVMKGYWKKTEETSLVLRDGWLLTGDIAHMDSEGYFYITDRKKDLIKYKDYSVYPRELEDILYEHEKVKICAVVGIPDQVAGEIPKAFVVLRGESTMSDSDVKAFVNGKVAPYKAIREVEFRKELPMSAAGKVLRRILKEEEKKENITSP